MSGRPFEIGFLGLLAAPPRRAGLASLLLRSRLRLCALGPRPCALGLASALASATAPLGLGPLRLRPCALGLASAPLRLGPASALASAPLRPWAPPMRLGPLRLRLCLGPRRRDCASAPLGLAFAFASAASLALRVCCDWLRHIHGLALLLAASALASASLRPWASGLPSRLVIHWAAGLASALPCGATLGPWPGPGASHLSSAFGDSAAS